MVQFLDGLTNIQGAYRTLKVVFHDFALLRAFLKDNLWLGSHENHMTGPRSYR